MPEHHPDIKFSEKDPATINSNKQKVTIVKHPINGNSNTVWVSFKSSERNTVDWFNLYTNRASSFDIQSGTQIKESSKADASGSTNFAVGASPRILIEESDPRTDT